MSIKRKRKQSLQVIKSRSTQVAAKSVAETHAPAAGVLKESYALILGFAGIFLLVALFNSYNRESANPMGMAGENLAHSLLGYFGLPSFFLPLLAFASASSLWKGKVLEQGKTGIAGGKLFLILLGFLFFAISCSSMAAVIGGSEAGGSMGSAISQFLTRYFSSAGALLLSFAGALISFVTTTKISSSIFVKGAAHSLRFLSLGLGDSLSLLKAFGLFVFNTIKNLFFSSPKKTDDLEHEDDIEQTDTWSIDGITKSRTTEKAKKKILTFTKSELVSDVKIDKTSQVLENPLISRRTYDEYLLETKKSKAVVKPTPVQKKQQEKTFSLPPLDLLVRGDSSLSSSPKDDELINNSKRLEVALDNFKISGKIVEVHPGPVVTLYQFEPGAGVKVQRIITLADDLALALKVASVRVFAPVPGKGTVGIEVPNSQREIVRLRDVIDTEDYKVQDTPLLLALGKDTYGAPYVADLSKMPHLLIAGATGTGKSVCINSILLSLLYRNTPDQLRLIMIDPKMLELSTYEHIPHLSSPVVTNPKHARAVLWWAVEEMDRRYELMKESGVRNIAMYNRLIEERNPQKKDNGSVIELEEKDIIASGSPDQGVDRSLDTDISKVRPNLSEPLPRVVIVVDELADLMLTVGREIEELLTRLAQKARASGIHLILATQRPSVNVITGLIKANFPARISFKVAGKVDARTVMDTSGAERLLGQGDMLFMSPTVGRVMRLHSPFVSDKEVNDVVEAIRSQGEPRYDQGIEKTIKKLEENERPDGMSSGQDEYDEFYDQAVQLVVEKGQASTSMVQRAFRIGYNRAARILEVMEREGVVGPADGARPRQVLISDLI